MSKSWEAKDDEKERARQAFMREQAERDRAQSERRRRLCSFLKFPQVCGDARCKRARRCAGDVDACFARFWPQVPEEIKENIRHAIKLVGEGAPPHEAAIQAQAYVGQRRRIGEEIARREAARATGTPAEPASDAASIAVTRTHAPARVSGPRIRAL